MDPRTDAEYDRQKAEELRWQERHETNSVVRRDMDRAAQDYDAEADQIESALDSEEPVE